MFIWIEGVLSTYHEIYEGSTPFHEAAGQGRLEMCKLISKSIEDKNLGTTDNGWTPLHVAAKKGYLEIYQLLSTSLDNKNKLWFDKRILYFKSIYVSKYKITCCGFMPSCMYDYMLWFYAIIHTLKWMDH